MTSIDGLILFGGLFVCIVYLGVKIELLADRVKKLERLLDNDQR